MAFERRDSSGDAVGTKLVGTISSSDVSLTIADASGWPNGAIGKFYATLERGTSNEEKILVTSRSGNVLTLASSGDRGADGTTATAHSGGDIEHTLARQDVDEANFTVANTVGRITTAGDDIVATAANTFGRLPIGADNTVRVVDLSTPTKQKWTQLNETHLATSVAGAGLVGGNGTPLAVNPDNSTLEINADALRIKNAGVTGAKLDPAIVDSVTLQLTAGVLSFGAQPSWTAPSLVNSWANVGTGFSTAGYYKDTLGTVHLRGVVSTGSLTSVIFTLAAGNRPEMKTPCSVNCSTGAGRVDVGTDGTITEVSGRASTGQFLVLDGITFRAFA